MLIPPRFRVPDFVLRGIRSLRRGAAQRVHHWAFDTETHDGDPFTIQFAGTIRGVKKGWLQKTSRAQILTDFFLFLHEYGEAGQVNILWAHALEYDLGVSFVQFPEIWEASTWVQTLTAQKLAVTVKLRHFDNPFHDITVGGAHWRILDTMSWFKMSLERAGSDLQLPVRKLPRPDYLGQRKPRSKKEWESFTAYAVNDALSTLHLGEFIASMHGELDIPQSISIAHMASHVFRKQFIGDDPGRMVNYLRVPEQVRKPRDANGLLLSAMTREKRLPMPTLLPDQKIPFLTKAHGASRETFYASMYAYHGGKNGLYVAPGVYPNVREVDIVSAYPTAMQALPPLTDGAWREVDASAWAMGPGDPPVPSHAGLWRVSGVVTADCGYGVFMNHEGTQKFFSGERFDDVWITGWELASCWDEIRVDAMRGWIWEPAPLARNPFHAYVDFFFQKKASTPKTDPRREMYKLLLNALYGKLIQRAEEDGPEHEVVAGMLFNPFWASQITGHCRARLHQLEHRYQAIHSSTDSILTQQPVPAHELGPGLGQLEIKAEGTLTVLRNKLYLLKDAEGVVKKFALHGFRGRAADLDALLRKGGETAYTVQHMWRPRESRRTGQKPFRMTPRAFHLEIPKETWAQVTQQYQTLTT